VQTEISSFIQTIKDELPIIIADMAYDVFDELSDESKRNLVDNLLDQRRDITELDSLRKSGEFLRYVDNESIILLFRQYAERFFDGAFWSEAYQVAPGLSADMMSKAQQRVKSIYLNCLEDICTYQDLRNPVRDITVRARASLAYLQRRLV